MSEHKLKTGKVGEKVVGTYKKIEESFVDSFLEKDESESGYTLKTGKTAENVVNSYKSIEDTVVGAYKKIEDQFVETFLEEVETPQEAENSNGPRPGNTEITEKNRINAGHESAKRALELSREISEKHMT